MLDPPQESQREECILLQKYELHHLHLSGKTSASFVLTPKLVSAHGDHERQLVLAGHPKVWEPELALRGQAHTLPELECWWRSQKMIWYCALTPAPFGCVPNSEACAFCRISVASSCACLFSDMSFFSCAISALWLPSSACNCKMRFCNRSISFLPLAMSAAFRSSVLCRCNHQLRTDPNVPPPSNRERHSEAIFWTILLRRRSAKFWEFGDEGTV